MSTSKTQSLPELPPDTKGAPAAFHSWCTDELRRRRSRDLELDVDRYRRATSVVLRRLGVTFPEDTP
ncbi:MAG: hypothetical protein KDA24_25630 [Deltaproteobacteria bacterium]|nr:hypothetical protein [Deltaproteobacteria bacterium]